MTCRGQVNAVGICLKSLYGEAPDLEQDRSMAQTVLRPRQFSAPVVPDASSMGRMIYGEITSFKS